MTKTQLRKQYLQQRRALSDDVYQQACAALTAHFFAQFELRPIRYLHLFLPIVAQREIDTWRIAQHVWQQQPQVQLVVPRSNKHKATLQHHLFNADTVLETNAWGIPEPTTAPLLSDVQLLDMVLIPLLCFDHDGYRVGYGKGFYDRFLAQCRVDTQKIGLSLFPPVPRIVDVDAYDVKIDAAVTPAGVIYPKIQDASG